MDMAHGLKDPFDSRNESDQDHAVTDNPLAIGNDERRMHVRAYNHWVSLLAGRPYPTIENLQHEHIVDFAPHSVLLDFSKGVENPEIRYLGSALREECGVTASIRFVGDVPSRSLLSRLTDHYLQIIANRAPIGFEAEFVGQRGHSTAYRGILMPFSSDGDGIDFIYGVINWKELVDAGTQARLVAEVEESRRTAPQIPAPTAPIWADGPSAELDTAPEVELDIDIAPLGEDASLADQLQAARESAAVARASDMRSRAALYRALSRAYDFVVATENDAEGYAELLEDAGLTVQARAPMTPAVKLVFGADYDKTRITEFATVLANARRLDVPTGGLEAFLDAAPGGIKGVVKAERAFRRPPTVADAIAQAAEQLRNRPPLANVAIDAGGDEFVLLLARAGAKGLDIVARVDDDAALTKRAIRRAAA